VARIAGVDLPKDKRIEVALTYIYGIGPALAKRQHQQRHPERVQGRRPVAHRSDDERQALDGHRLLPGTATSQRSARPWSEYQE